MLTFDQIKELIELVAEHGLEGVSIERSGFKVEIVGHHPPPPAATTAPAIATSAPPAPPALAPVASTGSLKGGGEKPESDDEGLAVPDDAELVTSPIVGTFYEAPNPDAPPYARVGDRVQQGQVLCIVEAMKLMNEIESEHSGVIVAIYPQNAQPVEFGEPLFAIQSD